MKTFLTTIFSVLLACTTLFAYDHTIQGRIIEFRPELPDAYRNVHFQSDDFALDTMTRLDDTGYFSIDFYVNTSIAAPVRIDVIYTDPCTGVTITEEVQVAAEGVTEMAFPSCGDPVECMAGFIPAYQGADRLTVVFTDESWTPNITSVHWDFGDGNTSTAFSPTHTYETGGEYLVRYEIMTTDSCTAVTESLVQVGNIDWYLQCVAFIYYDQSEFVPENVHFFAEFGLETIQVNWDFGDGNTSNEQYPRHTYAESGEYEVKLTATLTDGIDTCSAETAELIIVEEGSGEPRCRADFDMIQQDETNRMFAFVDYSEATGEIIAWQWDLGDGTTSAEQHVEHQYDVAINEDVDISLSITTTDGCTDEVTYQLYVGEWEEECVCDDFYSPACAFDDAGNLIHFSNSCEAECEGFFDHFPCDGCVPYFSWEEVENDTSHLIIQFYGPVTDNIVATVWDFGDGNSSEAATPLHIYAEAGLYDVTLTVVTAGGCENSITQTIHVGEGCFCPEFYDPVCVVDPTTDEILMFGNHCFAECEGYFDFFHCDDGGGDGGGEDRFCQAMFWFNTEDNLNVQFEDLSMTTDEAVTWEWDFGDGNTSNEQNPLHTYVEEGIYFVTLTVRDAELCSSSFSMLVWTSEEVFYSEDCRALFFPIVQDNQVILLDVSQGNVVSWEWDLGDGTTANGPFVQHTYEIAGEAIITLKITTDDGCESEFVIVLNLESGNFHGASDPAALSTTTKNLEEVATVISLSPNPTIDLASLKINSLQSTDYQIFISNVAGQVVQQQKGQLQRGEQQIEVNLNGLPTGVYVLTMRSAGQIWSEKIIKL